MIPANKQNLSYQREVETLRNAGIKVSLHKQKLSWQARLGFSLFGLRLRLRKSAAHLDDQTYIARKRASEPERVKYFKPIESICCEPVVINGCAAEWISSKQSTDNTTRPAILYLHGGSFTGGSLATHRALCGNIAHFSQARVLLVEYRLAPEHPFPTAVDDVVETYRWLLDTGIEPANLFLAGDSSGGGLALSALTVLRDSGMPMPKAVVCLSAIVDLACDSETWNTNAKYEVVTTVDSARRSIKMYLSGADPHNSLASPLYADLSGFPPILFQVGSNEVLFADAIRFAKKAHDMGVDITLDIWHQMVHSWHYAANVLPEGKAAIQTIGDFVKSRG